MVNFASGYNFMDLLKDKGVVPRIEVQAVDLGSLIERMAGRLSRIEQSAGHYDFMDLMQDKGFVPIFSNDNDKGFVTKPSNDNDVNVQAA